VPGCGISGGGCDGFWGRMWSLGDEEEEEEEEEGGRGRRRRRRRRKRRRRREEEGMKRTYD